MILRVKVYKSQESVRMMAHERECEACKMLARVLERYVKNSSIIPSVITFVDAIGYTAVTQPRDVSLLRDCLESLALTLSKRINFLLSVSILPRPCIHYSKCLPRTAKSRRLILTKLECV